MREGITGSSLFSELLEQFNLQKGLVPTLVDLSIRPGIMLRGYLDSSRRARYVPALTYLFLAAAISLVLQTIFDPMAFLLSGQTTYSEDFRQAISELNTNHADKFTFLLVPIFALSTKLFFRFWKFSFVEHPVINAFATAQEVLIFYVPGYLLIYLIPALQTEVSINTLEGIVATYRIWVYVQVSKGSHVHFVWAGIWRSFLVIAMLLLITSAILIPIGILTFTK